ncbi:MAG: oxidoreductase [Chitinophagales bacterium]
MQNFTLKNAPSQKGKLAIVTGANDGVGFETSLGLLSKEAKLIMACRNPEKANNAIIKLKKAFPKAEIEFIQLDLSKLSSVKSFVKEFKQKFNKLDILINNAGIMVPPFSKTEDGFESQMAVNYFAHFLLTGLLMNELEAADKARVISLSSIAHKRGKIDFDNLNAEKNYNKSAVYSQSKLACLIFAYELDRKLRNAKSSVISLAAHPGVSATNLFENMPKLATKIVMPLSKPLLNSPKAAALPSLMAALDSEVESGDYYGPSGFMEMSGKAAKAHSKPQSHNLETAKKLWEVSEKLVGFKFEF